MLTPLETVKNPKMNCLFLPGMPCRVKNFAIFDDLKKNGSNIYFHQYPGTYGVPGVFNIDTAELSIIEALNELGEKKLPIIIVAYSFSTYLLLRLNISKYNNIIGILLFSPITGLDEASINENFYEVLARLNEEEGFSINLDKWRSGLNDCKIKDVYKTLDTMSKTGIPTIFSYTRNDKLINWHSLATHLEKYLKKNGYGSFLVIDSGVGDHRMDTYYSDLARNIIMAIRVTQDLYEILGKETNVYYWGSSQIKSLYSQKYSDIDLLVLNDNYFEYYKEIDKYILKFNKTESIKLDISLNKRKELTSNRFYRFNRGVLITHGINNSYFPLNRIEAKIMTKWEHVQVDAYHANIVNLRELEKQLCRISTSVVTARLFAKVFLVGLFYLLHTRGIRNADMNNMQIYLESKKDRCFLTELNKSTKCLSSSDEEHEYKIEDCYRIVKLFQKIVEEQEELLNIKYNEYRSAE